MFESIFSCSEGQNLSIWRCAIANRVDLEKTFPAGMPVSAPASVEDAERVLRLGCQNLVQGALAVPCEVQRDVLESEIPERV